jgi:hypothetical protein
VQDKQQQQQQGVGDGQQQGGQQAFQFTSLSAICEVGATLFLRSGDLGLISILGGCVSMRLSDIQWGW